MFRFDNSFVRDLPGMYERWTAVRASEPRLVALNRPLADELGIDGDWLGSPEGSQVLVGNVVPDGAEPVAQAYAGHQFGGFSPRLGDGRALLLGEVIDEGGDRHDVHLKGSGRTPFARGGDGLATVGPMLREYLMCEAMAALGVPTTRALAVVATGDMVRRETMLPGAVFVRTAASHLRVGSFQYAASLEDQSVLAALVDYAIARHHPGAADADTPALGLLESVMDAQIELIARWMLLGFIHGVMNTDNVTISGETIDYGPCAFMDAYNPSTVFSSIDHGGRYAYGNQPSIGQWNLARLAEPLLSLMHEDQDVAVERATELLRQFPERFGARMATGLAAKLGLSVLPESDPTIVDDLLALMATDHVDFTSAWRSLARVVRGDREALRNQFVDLAGVDAWLDRFDTAHAGTADREAAAVEMDLVNPLYIPRNHLVEEALTAGAAGDLEPFHALSDVLASPFAERSGLERFAQSAPVDFAERYQTFCGT
ncbi:MAG: YdiU family protein [Ilumatobacter sp.]